MGDFRRFVIDIGEVALIIVMILTTLGMAIIGTSIGISLDRILGPSRAGGPAIFGFLIGGAVGFVIAAASAAVVFMLAETAKHTKQTADEVRRLVDLVSQASQSLAVRDAPSQADAAFPSSSNTGHQRSAPLGNELDQK